jgi:hypothetical protein
MRFTLHYRGPLKANAGPAHKHELRRHFHQQLKKLWSQKPLVEIPRWIQPARSPGDYHFLRPMAPFTFVPLVTEEADAVAELSVTLLRPEAPGGLITQGGDIDNRLKTLFDALAVPPQPNALPPGSTPALDEDPLFCLLEDDNLVVSVAVRTEQLLEPVSDPSVVDVTIAVQTRVTRNTMDNDLFA